jgi:hypothetical protein
MSSSCTRRHINILHRLTGAVNTHASFSLLLISDKPPDKIGERTIPPGKLHVLLGTAGGTARIQISYTSLSGMLKETGIPPPKKNAGARA